jgi:hypothetical protein
MSVKIREQASWERRVEKQMARDLDDHLVSEGHRSIVDLKIRNDYFADLNLSGFKISRIGGKSLQKQQ